MVDLDFDLTGFRRCSGTSQRIGQRHVVVRRYLLGLGIGSVACALAIFASTGLAPYFAALLFGGLVGLLVLLPGHMTPKCENCSNKMERRKKTRRDSGDVEAIVVCQSCRTYARTGVVTD